MNGFYAYIIGTDGHIINRVDLAFEKQADAEERAKALVDGHDVELWQLDRKIATFKHSSKAAPCSHVASWHGTDQLGESVDIP